MSGALDWPEPRIWDISQPLHPETPVWPGDAQLSETRVVSISQCCPFNLTHVTMSMHTGSHADGPLHYRADGLPIGEADISAYLGPAQLITVTSHSGLITSEMVMERLMPNVRRVLFRTFEQFPLKQWRSDFAAIDPALIEQLGDRNCVLIGTDAPSLDPQESKTLDAHAAVGRRGLSILEGLVFDNVPDGLYELIAAPLRLMNADASPVRALLRELPTRL